MKIAEKFQDVVAVLCRIADRKLKDSGSVLGALPSNTEAVSQTCVIVDAEVDAATVLGEYLVAQGLRVWTASSGEEALRVIRQVQPALVLVDLKPAGMGGRSLLVRIHQMSSKSRVVILTGWPFLYSAYTEADIREFHVDACYLKPVSVDTILNIVSKSLGDLPLASNVA